MPVSQEMLDEVALSRAEYDLIVEKLGREPSPVELGMFGSLWSEHCGYKHSKPLLKMFPGSSSRLLIGAGQENAGAIDIGNGMAVVMKMESHNHPSAIEPFQGAATGVGGIVRDIFTMGARPIALMNSLRFGPLTNAHNRFLLNGVVGGIASYGNCLGIPDVGGEIYFDQVYSHNPLVNALCLGLIDSHTFTSARASGPGNLLMLVGADTGRDGLHGASGLASRTFEEQKELRSAVQVGNPFLEKLLIEACLELVKHDWIIGLQDLGAAGLTSASVESAARGGSGIEIDVMKVPRREQGMTPYEVMLSESQERMLVVVKKGCEKQVKNLFDRWDLRCDVIGQVTNDGTARIKEGKRIVAELPVEMLTEPPLYRATAPKPGWLKEVQKFDVTALPDLEPEKCGETLLNLLGTPNIASKKYVYRQYDHQVQNNTVVLPGSDAAVLRIKGTTTAIALTTDGNGRYCYLDPYNGGAIAVAEAARNLVCSGAKPVALTDCLNFGNPEKLDVYYQLKECIRGMSSACRALGVPVISGNVSLYNETKGHSIYPTPVVGMLGLMEDVTWSCTAAFQRNNDLVYLIGPCSGGDLGGSEYLAWKHGQVKGKPEIDLPLEKRVQKTCLDLIYERLIHSAHDCSDGGLGVALAESAILGGYGFKGWLPVYSRLDVALFGESQSRIVVSLPPDNLPRFEKIVARNKVLLTKLGKVTGDRFIIEGRMDLPLSGLAKAWENGFQKALEA